MKTYIHYGHKEYKPELFTKISNIPAMAKPSGGLWASDINAEFGWKDWCVENDFRECNSKDAFYFILNDNARVLTINSKEDLDDLPKVKDKYNLSSIWTMLDFEKLSKKYDAIEVNISNDYNLYYALYGWDCDSILVMNPDVVRVI